MDQPLLPTSQRRWHLPPATTADLYEADYFAERREDFALFRRHIRPRMNGGGVHRGG
jgi:hypothetical protein